MLLASKGHLLSGLSWEATSIRRGASPGPCRPGGVQQNMFMVTAFPRAAFGSTTPSRNSLVSDSRRPTSHFGYLLASTSIRKRPFGLQKGWKSRDFAVRNSPTPVRLGRTRHSGASAPLRLVVLR
jgi:hypothetical protein